MAKNCPDMSWACPDGYMASGKQSRSKVSNVFCLTSTTMCHPQSEAATSSAKSSCNAPALMPGNACTLLSHVPSRPPFCPRPRVRHPRKVPGQSPEASTRTMCTHGSGTIPEEFYTLAVSRFLATILPDVQQVQQSKLHTSMWLNVFLRLLCLHGPSLLQVGSRTPFGPLPAARLRTRPSTHGK